MLPALHIVLQELPRKDGADTVSLGPGLELPSAASGTLRRPTSLSRHASAAGFPLSGASSWTLGRGHRSPMTVASPAEPPTEGPCPDAVEDISHLLADVARFAEGLEKLKECILHDGECWARRPGRGRADRYVPDPGGQGRVEGGTWGGTEGTLTEGSMEEAVAAEALRGV